MQDTTLNRKIMEYVMLRRKIYWIYMSLNTGVLNTPLAQLRLFSKWTKSLWLREQEDQNQERRLEAMMNLKFYAIVHN